MPRCFAQMHPVFQPAMRLIASITNAVVPTVTTTIAHNYKTGTIVRLDIPPADGMQQLNQQTCPIIVTGTTTFTIPIDTTAFDPFSIDEMANVHVNICALVVPIGETNDILTAATQNVLPNNILP